MKKSEHDQTLGLLAYWNTVYEWSCIKILNACEELHENKTRVLWLQFLQNKIVLAMWFHAQSGIADRNKFTSAVVIHMHPWKNKFLPHVACIYDLALYSRHSFFLTTHYIITIFSKKENATL